MSTPQSQIPRFDKFVRELKIPGPIDTSQAEATLEKKRAAVQQAGQKLRQASAPPRFDDFVKQQATPSTPAIPRFDEFVQQSAPSTRDQSILTDPQKRTAIAPTRPSTTTVSLGEGAEMASPDEMRAYNRAHPSDAIPDVPTPRVTMPNKPLEFHRAGLATNAPSQGLAGLTHQIGTELATPTGHQEFGEPVRISGQGDPVEAYMKTLGPEYPALNEMYRKATGKNLIYFPQKLQAEDNGELVITPSRSSVDAINAFAQGVREGGIERGLSLMRESVQPHASMGAAQHPTLARMGDAASEFVATHMPGIASIDKPGGIKTDVARGALDSASLGLLNTRRDITPEERALNPQAESEAGYRYGMGEVAGSLAPLVGTEAALSRLGLGAAERTAATFGITEAGRQAVNAVRGRPVELTAPLESTLTGLVMSKLAGAEPGLVRKVVAFIAPGAAVDIARGTSADQAVSHALTNAGFALVGGEHGERAPEALDASAPEALGINRAQRVPDFENVLAQREANVSPEGLTARQVMRDQEAVHHSNLQPRTAEGQFDGPPEQPVVFDSPSGLRAVDISAPAAGMVRLYRGEPVPSQPTYGTRGVSDAPDEFRGRWFTTDPQEAADYAAANDVRGGGVTYIDVPAADAQQYKAANVVKSRLPFPLRGNEFVLPNDLIQQSVGVPSRSAVEGEMPRSYEPQVVEPQSAISGNAIPEPATPPTENQATPELSEAWQMTSGELDRTFPRITGTVDGRTVGTHIANQDSIGSSLGESQSLQGIREVPMSVFEASGPSYSASENARTRKLADEIQESGHIDPLIVVVDAEGPYILEGGHRFDALQQLGAKSFPAKVVIDSEEHYNAVERALKTGQRVRPEVLAEYPDLVVQYGGVNERAIASAMGQEGQQTNTARSAQGIRQTSETVGPQNARRGSTAEVRQIAPPREAATQPTPTETPNASQPDLKTRTEGVPPNADASRVVQPEATNQNRQATGTGEQSPIPEINVPESQETIQGQIDHRGFTFVPNENKGTVQQPRGTRALKRAEGIIYYDPKRITDTAALKTTPLGDLLGHVENKSAATTEAVVARDANDTEIQSSAASPEGVSAQIAETQNRLPNTQVGVEAPENVITERITGIANRVEAQRRAELGQEPPIRGESISPADSVQRGRELLSEGSDPQEVVAAFKKNGSISADAMALVRARHEELTRAANKAFDEGGQNVNDPKFKAVEKVRQDWWETVVRPMQTEWSNTGRAQQGETGIDSGTYYGLYRALKDRTGHEPTPSQASTARDLSTRVATLERQVRETSAALKAALDKTNESPTNRSSRPSRTPRLERIDVYFDRVAQEAQARLAARASKARAEVTGNKGQRGAGVNPVDVAASIKDWSIIGAAKLVKKGISFAQWSESMVKDFGEEIKPHLDNVFMESRRLIDEKRAADKQPPSSKTIRNAEARRDLDQKAREITRKQSIAALSERLSTGGKITPEDAKAVWAHLRDYIDRDTEFDDAVQKTATDLGIKAEQVRRVITQQPGVRRITDDLYRQMAARRAARTQAEIWVQNADAPRAVKALRAIRDGMFTMKIAGGLHGTVGPVTHAGENIFHPTRWVDYVTNIARTWKSVLSEGYHERAMRDLENDPNFITAQRAGLKNNPHKVYDDYQNSFMGRLLGSAGQAGNRGFDVLKIMRQDFFDHEWNKLADSEKTPEMAKRIAQVMNGATGASNFRLPGGEIGNSLVFAAPLEGSRWARLVRDPAQAIGIASRLTTKAGRESVSAADRYFLKKQIKEKAGFAATYAAALALNQGILMATGSRDRVNLTDPSKGDWLRFKVKGRAIEPTGGIISTIDFLGKLANIAAGEQNPREGRGSRMGHALYQYGRGKLSPIASTAADVVTQSDFRERPVPWSSDKERKGKPRYSWKEYFLVQQTPIPVSEGIRDAYSTMHNSGVPTPTINSILRGAAIGTFSGATGIKIGEEYPERPQGRQRVVRSNQPRTRTARQ